MRRGFGIWGLGFVAAVLPAAGSGGAGGVAGGGTRRWE